MKLLFTIVTGHNPSHIIPQVRIPYSLARPKKPTESHIADLKAKFQDWRT